jgi:hypothetical protein
MESDKYARHAKSEKYNEDFDKQLKETKVFTKELFEKFYDAYLMTCNNLQLGCYEIENTKR